MRKLSIYLLSTAAVLTVTSAMPLTALAAVNTYNLPGGNGKMIVMGGGNMNDLKQILGQIGGGIKLPDCDQNVPNSPGNWLPDFNQPGNNVPDNSLPDHNIPSPEFPDQNQPGTDSSMDAYASRVVELVNAERAKAGLSPLSIHTQTVGAAQTRAKEIETSFSHTRPNGSSFSTALTAAGVSFRASGENIAYGQKSPEQVMESWMNSSGHRANILNANFTSIGVGHYKNAAGVDYWTQLFIN